MPAKPRTTVNKIQIVPNPTSAGVVESTYRRLKEVMITAYIGHNYCLSIHIKKKAIESAFNTKYIHHDKAPVENDLISRNQLRLSIFF